MKNRMKQIALSLVLASAVCMGSQLQALAATPAPVLTDRSAVGELTFWNSIKESGSADDYRTYLENFPNGMFVDPAMDRFEKSGGAKSDLSPEVISASLNAVTQPAITDDAQTTKAPAVVPKPVQQKKFVKTKKKKLAVASKSKKKVTKTVRTKTTKKCRAGSIYDNKCLASVKPRKPVKQAAVRKKKVSSDGGSGGMSAGGGGWGGGGGTPGGGGNPGGGGWGGG